MSCMDPFINAKNKITIKHIRVDKAGLPSVITIRHIALLKDFQRRGIGTLLLNYTKKCYERYRFVAETDEESVDFYFESDFTCHEVKGRYGNLRYKCEFN